MPLAENLESFPMMDGPQICNESNDSDVTSKEKTEVACQGNLDIEEDVTKLGCMKAEVSHFQIISVLGQGSFGKVFLAKKLVGEDKNKLYAMKVLKKATLKYNDKVRSKMERNILADVQHPFIVKLNYAFQTKGKLYLILDFLRGGDLFGRLSKEIMFTVEDAKFYLAELALALIHLHSLGIVYRDLKPENILLDTFGHIKLTDFGLSKESLTRDESITYSFCGTIEYMAPEIISRKGHSKACDWWSFGVLMFEMLTGSLPFHSNNKKETMLKVMKSKLSMPHYIPFPAQALLRQLFKRNPVNRLGYGPNEGTDIRSHIFFNNLRWNDLVEKKIAPPFQPAVAAFNNATYYFDQAIVSQTPRDSPMPPISVNSQNLFRGFSFVAPTLSQNACQNNLPKLESELNQELNKNLDLYDASNSSDMRSVYSDYHFCETIGNGSFGVCKKVVHKASKKVYAVKIINGAKRNPREEVGILLRYGKHRNIITLFDVFIDKNIECYLIMEFMEGGDLFDYVVTKESLSEREIASRMFTIFGAVEYLHSNGVVHRDLKPANIMFATSKCTPQCIRICDFGFAKQLLSENGLLMTPCYTANYVAPEVLKSQGYDTSCDIWSLGVIMYFTITGQSPFSMKDTDAPNQILFRIGKGDFKLSGGCLDFISSHAKNLIKGMLNVNPNNRLSIKQVMSSIWITNRESLQQIKLAKCTVSKNIKNSLLLTYRCLKSPMKKPVLEPINASLLAQRRQNNKVTTNLRLQQAH